MPNDKTGGRLERQRELGTPGMARRFGVVEDRLRPDPMVEGIVKAKLAAKAAEEARLLEKKGGRPSLGKPWEAEGVSRRTWFRNRKETP